MASPIAGWNTEFIKEGLGRFVVTECHKFPPHTLFVPVKCQDRGIHHVSLLSQYLYHCLMGKWHKNCSNYRKGQFLSTRDNKTDERCNLPMMVSDENALFSFPLSHLLTFTTKVRVLLRCLNSFYRNYGQGRDFTHYELLFSQSSHKINLRNQLLFVAISVTCLILVRLTSSSVCWLANILLNGKKLCKTNIQHVCTCTWIICAPPPPSSWFSLF